MSELPNDDKTQVVLTEEEREAVTVKDTAPPEKKTETKSEPAKEDEKAEKEEKPDKAAKIDIDDIFSPKKTEVKKEETSLKESERERLLDLEFKESLREHQEWLAKLTSEYTDEELKVLEPEIEKLTQQTENPDDDFFDKLGKSGFNVAQKSAIIVATAELACRSKLNKILEKRIKDAYENGIRSEQVRKTIVDKAGVKTPGETKGETKSKEQALYERARKGDKEAMNDPDFLLDDSDLAALNKKRGG